MRNRVNGADITQPEHGQLVLILPLCHQCLLALKVTEILKEGQLTKPEGMWEESLGGRGIMTTIKIRQGENLCHSV